MRSFPRTTSNAMVSKKEGAMEYNEEQKKIIEEIEHTLVQIQKDLDALFNQETPLEKIANIAEQWRKVRQAINNQNIGILLGFQLTVASFPLSTDEKKNVGQKNLSDAFVSDKTFLKTLKLRPP